MRIFFIIAALFCATALSANPVQYLLNTEKSKVGFIYDFQGDTVRGTLPLKSADLRLDFTNIGKSRINVTLDATRATGGFIFATQILRGDDMFAANTFPDVRFVSTKITGQLPTGTVTGNLTLKGITRPVTLDAKLFRQAGTDPTDLTRLAIQLTGTLDRTAFGLTGYPGFVGQMVNLDIMAWIDQSR